MTAITSLIYDPSPGITPSDGSIIRTDQQNAIADLFNGISAENYNLVQKVNKKTTTYSAVLTDFIITADATSAGFTITLPDASATGFVKKIMAVKKIDTSANLITIQTVSSQTFDGGATSMILYTPQETVIFQSDGSNWIILDHYLVPKLSGQEKFFNPAGTFYYSIVTSAITANRNLTIPLIIADDTLATLGLSQTFTATTTQINNLKLGGQINANGQTILNTGTLTLPTATTTLAGLAIAQSWTQAQTFIASGIIIAGAGAGLGTLTYANSASSVTVTLPSTATTLAGLAVVQTFTAATTFQNSTLLIGNPAATFAYTIVSSAITANRNLTLPLITGADTLVTLGLAQAFTGIITFAASGIKLTSSGGGLLTFAAASNASSFTMTVPMVTDTIAVLGQIQTFSAAITFSAAVTFSSSVTVYSFINTIAAITYASTTNLDFSLNQLQTLSLTGAITFTTSNLAAGISKTIKILCDGTNRAFTFPAWIWVGTIPTNILANKTGILTLTSFSTTDGAVVAAYAVQS